MTVASILLTIVLVLITGFYAYQTKRTVDELRRARGANLLPKVTLSFQHPGGPAAFVLLTNRGAGPALDVDLTMSYEPGGPEIPWFAPTLSVGESARFRPPGPTISMDDLTSQYDRIALRGTCKDALGDTHRIEHIVDIKSYWELGKQATQLLEHDYQKKAAEELEKIRRQLEEIKRLVQSSQP